MPSKVALPRRKDAATRARVREARTPKPSVIAQQAAFLDAFANVGLVTGAARAAGVDRNRHYEWLADAEKYPDYADRFKDAHEQACDRLEQEAIRRGAEGWDEPVYQGGKKVGVVRRYSDRLLELTLKARRPEQYRERHDLTSGGEKVSAGVLVVPGVIAAGEWAATAAGQQRKLEQEAADAAERAGGG